MSRRINRHRYREPKQVLEYSWAWVWIRNLSTDSAFKLKSPCALPAELCRVRLQTLSRLFNVVFLHSDFNFVPLRRISGFSSRLNSADDNSSPPHFNAPLRSIGGSSFTFATSTPNHLLVGSEECNHMQHDDTVTLPSWLVWWQQDT